MNKKFQTTGMKGGFTIVESMIVLAIASIILLLVILAVPAVSRNSHNNQRKQDVALILQAVSHYELNNSGTFPPNCGGTGNNSCAYPDPAQPNDNFLRFSFNDLGYYDPTMVFATGQSNPSQTNQLGVTSTEIVRVFNYEKCDSNNQGQATITGAGYNDVVALYALQASAGNTASECQQL